jgi:N-acetylgalactosamine kinase
VDAGTRERFARLTRVFEDAFGGGPDAYARSPGRVNLIGEHIDYEGYSVLPMAIGLDTIVAYRVKLGSSEVTVGNTNEKYTTKTFSNDPTQEVDVASLHWSNYVMCGYKGVFDFLKESGEETPELVGLELMIDGTVPTGSGLSSSSALCCAVAVAVMSAYGLNFTKGDIADFTCKCERYSGTQSGGMDQAISIMGQAGVAKLVDFNPISTNDVVLPDDAAFIIGNCLAVSNKAEGAHERYNLRVVECRLAAMVLGVKLGMTEEEAATVETLKEIENYLGSMSAAKAILAEHLHEGYYDAREIEEIIGVEAFMNVFSTPASQAVLAHTQGYKLLSRAMHVFAEAGRVHLFAASCAMGVELNELGAYMNGSHESCRALYECSCPELDELVDAFRSSGALGARLTGAGWGGCAVALVHKDMVQTVLDSVKDLFYRPRVEAGVISEAALSSALFATMPSSGAAILKGLTFA